MTRREFIAALGLLVGSLLPVGAGAADGLRWEKVNYKFTSVNKYVTVTNGMVIVDVPKDLAETPSSAWARGTIDLTAFDNNGFALEIDALEADVTDAHGIKFMVTVHDHLWGRKSWLEPVRSVPKFDFKHFDITESVGMPRGTCDFSIGLQNAKGRIKFNLNSLRIRKISVSQRRPPPGFKAEYPDYVLKRPQLKGMMLNTDEVKEDDIRTLASWGGKLARFQIGMMFRHAPVTMPPEENVRIWFEHFDRHLKNLDDVLCWGEKYGVKVMIDLHLPPGQRYNKEDAPKPDLIDDHKMFHVKEYALAYLKAWRILATRYKGRGPVVYGYDLINEPTEKPGRGAKVTYWELQDRAIKAIRAIDPDTTIIVSSNWGGGPSTFATLTPFPYPNIIYQVHMYRPQPYTLQSWDMVSRIDPDNRYPDPEKNFNIDFLRKELEPVRKFEELYGAKIVCGEWSCIMWAPGCETYLRDCAKLFDEYGWDWAYGCIREWPAWSIEHDFETDENGVRHFVKSEDNPRRRVLLEALNRPPANAK